MGADFLSMKALARTLALLPKGAVNGLSRLLTDIVSDQRSLKTYCKGDGATNDQAGLVQALGTAASEGWELYAANGAYVSTDTIPNLHAVKVAGQGSIKRGGNTFYFNPLPGQRNTLYCSPTGTGDGLSAAQPMGFQEALDAVLIRGPMIGGLWRIRLAAGTYQPPTTTGQFTLSAVSRFAFPMEIRGPDVGGWPNAPTAIIDGALTPTGRGLDLSKGHDIALYDLKIQGFTGGTGLNTAGGRVSLANVILFNNYRNLGALDFQDLVFFTSVKIGSTFVQTGCLIDGNNITNGFGIDLGFQSHITANYQDNDFTNVLKIQNCTYGLWAHESTEGHTDKVWIQSCGTGFGGQRGADFNMDRTRIWGCTKHGFDMMIGSNSLDNVIDFGEGSANANANKIRWNGGREFFRSRDVLETFKVNGISTNLNIAFANIAEPDKTNFGITHNNAGTTETEFWRPNAIKAGDICPIVTGSVAAGTTPSRQIDYKVIHELFHDLGFVVSNTGGAQVANATVRMYLGAIDPNNLVAFWNFGASSPVNTETRLTFDTDITSTTFSKTWVERKTGTSFQTDYQEKNTLTLRNGSDVPIIFTIQFSASETNVILSLRTGKSKATFGRYPY